MATVLFLCFIHSPGNFLISECRPDFEWVENRKCRFQMCLNHIWTNVSLRISYRKSVFLSFMWQNLHFYLYELTENLNQYACSWKYDKKKRKKKKKEKRRRRGKSKRKIVIAYWRNSTIQIDFFFFFFFFFLLVSKNIDLLNDNEMNKTS